MSYVWASNTYQVQTISLRLSTDAAVFFAVGIFLQRREQLRVICWAAFFAAVLSTLLGIVLHTQYFERFIGGFDDPNDYAAAMVPAIALAYMLFETSRSRLKKLVMIFGHRAVRIRHRRQRESWWPAGAGRRAGLDRLDGTWS